MNTTTAANSRFRTFEQERIAREFIEAYDLDAEQISFHKEETTPIFDFEAISALSLVLTNIQLLDTFIDHRDFDNGHVIARCVVTLPDGRGRSVTETAQVNEQFGEGGLIDSIRLAEAVAQSRAARRGIRAVGINLVRAHEQYKRSGKAATGNPDADPRNTLYREIHALAEAGGYIVGNDKTKYQRLMLGLFKVESACDLSEEQLLYFRNTLRALRDVKTEAVAVAAGV